MTFCVTIILMSCGGKTDKKNHRNCSTGRYGKTSFVQPMEKGTKFVCKDLGMDSMNIPHFNVIFSVNVVETKIKTINACAEIKKEEYKQMDIPDDAIMARGG